MMRWSLRRLSLGVSICVVGLALTVAGASPAAGSTYYVVVGGTGGDTCLSWTNACTLQMALGLASSGDQVWVAGGVYKPGTNQSDTFNIRSGVAVYGGFVSGDALLSDRDPAANVTVLSGDIDNNDAVDANGVDTDTTKIVGANSYTVVTMDGTVTPITASTILDGFTITGGDNTYGSNSGGGLSCNGSGSGHECSPTLSNLAFSGDRAGIDGGAIFNDGHSSGTSSPALTDVTFTGNSADGAGGAIYNNAGQSGTSSPTLTDVTFTGNSADGAGGAIFNDGHSSGTSSPTLTNVTLSGDRAGIYGGAIFNDGYSSGTSSPVLTNVILWGDSAGTGPEISNGDGTVTIRYSVVDGGCGSIAGASCGAGNLETNPVLGSLQNNGGWTETMALGTGSSAIDKGDEATCEAAVGPPAYGAGGLDQRGVSRPQGSQCDIGAYELDTTAPGVTVEQASTQADPTNGSPIHFTATFSEPIGVSSFAPSDVTLGGTAPGTLSAAISQIAPNDGTTFDIAVSGMTGSGTVSASIGADQITDIALNGNTASTSTDNTVTYDTTAPGVASTSLQATYVGQGPSSFTVSFSEPVTDTGIGGAESVTNPANYLLVEAGANGTFDTQSCQGGVVSDDTAVPITGVIYDAGAMSATAMVGNPLPLGTYRLFVCGTTSITDIAGNKLNGGSDSTFDFEVVAVTAIPALSYKGLALLGLLLAAGALALLRRS